MDNLPAQQIKLLQHQNELLEKNNQILNQMLRQTGVNSGFSTPPRSAGIEKFVENLHSDEMRSGFLVDAHRKSLWNVQIGLINEFARICAKHNLRWFAAYGTLLGAARHNGFIPWDDDVDLAMLRPDYDKFLKIAAEEIKYPYYFDYCYDYRVEGDTNSTPDEFIFPQVENTGGWPFFGNYIKLRDSRTTMIEFPNRRNVNQGIWIDIFPFDPVPSVSDTEKLAIFNVERVIFLATFRPHIVQQAIEKNQALPVDSDSLQNFLKLSYRKKGLYFENFLHENYFDSEYVFQLNSSTFKPNFERYRTANFCDVVYLPFEKIELPAPANYAENLEAQYGDWRTMKITHTHTKFWSADIPYYEYFRVSVL